MFRWGWDRVEAKLIDQKFVRRRPMNKDRTVHYQAWDYMVELREQTTKPIRLVIRERTYNLTNPQVGDVVPIRVNRKRTKAAFDLGDPRIGFGAAQKRSEAARKARQAEDEERFERKLRE